MFEPEDGRDPNCALCDLHKCDGVPPSGLASSYIADHGVRPAQTPMESEWLRGIALVCKSARLKQRK